MFSAECLLYRLTYECMSISLQLQRLERPGYTVELFVPSAKEVQDSYIQLRQVQAQVPFPHWTKLWPAALAMGDYIHQHPETVQGKNVLELAAGLGLPSLVAARSAKTVCCSDYLEASVATMARSIQHAGLTNVTSRLLDWSRLPDDLSAEVLLLSDINYDPDQFTQLYAVIERFFRQGTLILLTTPQRLMAKPFIEKLLPYCREQQEMVIDHLGQQTPVSLLVLDRVSR